MNRPELIILCGIPGSGKTTYAEKNCLAFHLSSDAIRKELYGDENTQGNPAEVFALMQDRAIEALNNGYDVIYDATNITRKDRASIIAKCPKFVKIECHIIWAPIETCIERDAARECTVGKEVIDRMLKRFQAPYYDEGIDEIKIVLPENFDQDQYINDSMNAMKITHDNPHHTLDVYEHCIEAYEHACKSDYYDLIHAEAAMIHDIGKPYTKSFINTKGELSDTAHYYGHQSVGAWIAYGMMVKDYTTSIDIAWLVSTHMAPFLNEKYYKNLPAYLKNSVDLLHEADLAAH